MAHVVHLEVRHVHQILEGALQEILLEVQEGNRRSHLVLGLQHQQQGHRAQWASLVQQVC
jgi:hypothetical protein